MVSYTVQRAITPPSLVAEVGVEPQGWAHAHVGCIEHWHAKSSSHRPATYVRLLYDDEAIYVRFDVMDRYVRVIHTEHQAPVWQDSCVEFFAQPSSTCAYFNFEINAGGSLLVSCIRNSTRTADGFVDYEMIDMQWVQQVIIGHSLPKKTDPSMGGPIAWAIAYRIPLSLLRAYVDGVEIARDTCWRANFFKCGGDPRFPHWGSWFPIGEVLNFHQPSFFGVLQFA